MYRDKDPESTGRRCPPGTVDLMPFRPMLRGIANRLLRPGDAEDLVQEVLLQALRAESLPCDAARLRGFLGVVARNVCIDWRRRRQRAPTEQPLDEAHAVSLDGGQAAALARAEVEAALSELPHDVRRVLLMRYREAATHGEIAARLGISEGAVAVRLHRARKRVRARRASGCRS